MASKTHAPIKFGPFEVTSQVFLRTRLSFALVNIKPFMAGHVLVCPLRVHPHLTGLSTEEIGDLFATVQRVQGMLARKYFKPDSDASPATNKTLEHLRGGSFNIAIQDGPDAGQTVPHVHVHIIPRAAGSTEGMEPGTQGNAVYDDMTKESGNLGGALWDEVVGKRPVPAGMYAKVDELSRKPRSMQEMVREAEEYRSLLDEMDREERGRGVRTEVGARCKEGAEECTLV